jgi:hypothetical protein
MDYFSNGISMHAVKASMEDVVELNKLLSIEGIEGMTSGIEAIFSESGNLILEAKDGCTPEFIDEKARKKVGEVLMKAGIRILDFGIAYTASREVVGCYGGTMIRFYDDGVVEWRNEDFPRDRRKWSQDYPNKDWTYNDWKDAVLAEDTILGYSDWVENQREGEDE